MLQYNRNYKYFFKITYMEIIRHAQFFMLIFKCIHIFVPNNHGIFDYQCLAMIITEMFKKRLTASVVIIKFFSLEKLKLCSIEVWINCILV